MLYKVCSAAVNGIDAYPVEVEGIREALACAAAHLDDQVIKLATAR